MKNWFRYLFYASLIFLVIALVRADYLVVPRIFDPVKLILSLVLLFAGFLLNALSWPKVLRHTPFRVSEREGIASHGLAIFGKYIPGKFWVIMGRAEYLALRSGYSRMDLASLSLDAQFIALWTALLLGTIGMISVKGISLYGISVLSLFILLSLVIFTPLFHRMTEWLLSKILRKQVRVPQLSLNKVTRAMVWYLISWSTWSVAFWFLAASLVSGPLPVNTAFAFALGGSMGILSIFAPGGLGVREGILTAYLALAGIAVQDATTIAVASRLWFLTGEVFIFLTALLLERRGKSKVN
ncbi:MAG: flippase-like domain-containing protein [Bacteroidales bacterium]|nr:flippase-like domain-containing protein [Bacteroidales bacterium]